MKNNNIKPNSWITHISKFEEIRYFDKVLQFQPLCHKAGSCCWVNIWVGWLFTQGDRPWPEHTCKHITFSIFYPKSNTNINTKKYKYNDRHWPKHKCKHINFSIFYPLFVASQSKIKSKKYLQWIELVFMIIPGPTQEDVYIVKQSVDTDWENNKH